jgi:hypothetical protein
MKLFITLLENVNKSRTSAGNLSLNIVRFQFLLVVSFDEESILRSPVDAFVELSGK